jgi:hypothetical protein
MAARAGRWFRVSQGILNYCLFRAVTVQTHLLLPGRDQSIALGGWDDKGLFWRRAKLIVQVHFDVDNDPPFDHLDVFHVLVPFFSLLHFFDRDPDHQPNNPYLYLIVPIGPHSQQISDLSF